MDKMDYDDNCELDVEDSNEIHILSNLKERFKKNKIYTYTANVLIAVNPFKGITELYSEDMIELYQGSSPCVLPPHIYASANKAIEQLRKSHVAQSLILTGETGSGKTENSKHLIKFMCQTSSSSVEIKNKVIAVNPILEAFGNAVTMSNKNSSRFTKLIQVQFNDKLEVVGANVSCHLLATERVCSKNNFNIFYMVLFGVSDHLRQHLQLDEDEIYTYLPDIQNRDKQNDINQFKVIDDAFSRFGISSEQKTNIYDGLAAIIHLGNVEFIESCEAGPCDISSSTYENFNNVCRLLKFAPTRLKNALLNRCLDLKVNSVGSEILVPLCKPAVLTTRNSLATALYDGIFKRILTIINKSTSFLNQNSKFTINILDIAGFESNANGNNYYEEFTINYINEKVQNWFVKKTIYEEQKYYRKEGIEIPLIPFFDNSRVLEAFEHKSNGLLAMLTDECKLPRPSTVNFVRNIHSRSDKSVITVRASNLKIPADTGFTIRHFTREVCYNAEDFVKKAMKPPLKLVSEIASISVSNPDTTNLRFEANKLIQMLQQSNCLFIHCVKPNQEQMKDTFIDSVVSKQLKTSNIFEYHKLMNMGFPNNIDISDLYNQYKTQIDQFLITSVDERQFCRILLRSAGLQHIDFKFGVSKIFIRSGKIGIMNNMLAENFNVVADNFKRVSKRLSKWRTYTIAAVFYSMFSKMFANHSKSERSTQINCEAADHDLNRITTDSAAGEGSAENKCQQSAHKLKRVMPAKIGSTKAKRAKNEKRPSLSTRFDQIGHFGAFDSNNDSTRCKLEGCTQKTRVFCEKCNVHICFNQKNNCFKIFHTAPH